MASARRIYCFTICVIVHRVHCIIGIKYTLSIVVCCSMASARLEHERPSQVEKSNISIYFTDGFLLGLYLPFSPKKRFNNFIISLQIYLIKEKIMFRSFFTMLAFCSVSKHVVYRRGRQYFHKGYKIWLSK